MPDSLTANLKLVDQEDGGNTNTWGQIADENFRILERAITQSAGIDISSGDSTLTDEQNRAAILVLTGSITSNRTVTVQTPEKMWLVVNNATGAFTVTVKTAAGTGIVVPNGTRLLLRSDGTNVVDTAPSVTLADGSVATVKLTDLAVTSSKLGNAAATAAKMGWHLDATLALSIDHAADPFLFFDQSASDYKRVLGQHIGVGKQTVNLLAAGCETRTTNGATRYTQQIGGNQVMASGYAFNAATDQAIQSVIFLPKNYSPSAGLQLRFYWREAAAAGTPGTNVIWAARAQYVRDGQVLDGAWGAEMEITDTYLGSGQVMISPFTNMLTPGGTHEENCVLVVEMYRKASQILDTYSADALLIGALATYTTTVNTDN